MAASTGSGQVSKAEYLKRYLSADENVKKPKGKLKKKRRKVQEKGWVFGHFLIELLPGRLCVG